MAIIENSNFNYNKIYNIGICQEYSSNIIRLIGKNNKMYEYIAQKFDMSIEDLMAILYFPNSVSISFLDEILCTVVSLKNNNKIMEKIQK